MVIAILLWQMLYHYSILQLLCWLMLLPSGRWNGHTFILCVVMANVVARWQMEWPLQGVSASLLVDVIPRGKDGYIGRITLISVLRCYAEPHSIYEADGTCLCFYLGMDCLPLYILLLLSICRGSGLPSLLI